MNRLIIGMATVAAITTGATVSVEATSAPPKFTWGAYGGADVRIDSRIDVLADLDRFSVVRSDVLRDSRATTSGVPGHNFRYRQFACIRIGHRIVC
jgi:hypothetical protein